MSSFPGFEVYLWRFVLETLRDRRNVPESSSKTSSAAGPQAHSRVSSFPNNQIASRFVEWMVCQRYSRGTISTYQPVTGEFLEFWGNARLFRVSHLDVREFLIEMSRRDLSADIVHRHLWALRCFFDFLC